MATVATVAPLTRAVFHPRSTTSRPVGSTLFHRQPCAPLFPPPSPTLPILHSSPAPLFRCLTLPLPHPSPASPLPFPTLPVPDAPRCRLPVPDSPRSLLSPYPTFPLPRRPPTPSSPHPLAGLSRVCRRPGRYFPAARRGGGEEGGGGGGKEGGTKRERDMGGGSGGCSGPAGIAPPLSPPTPPPCVRAPQTPPPRTVCAQCRSRSMVRRRATDNLPAHLGCGSDEAGVGEWWCSRRA